MYVLKRKSIRADIDMCDTVIIILFTVKQSPGILSFTFYFEKP